MNKPFAAIPAGRLRGDEVFDSLEAAIDRFVAQPQGAVRGPLHLDISTYASLIPGVSHGGSVVRGAAGRVVNIVGGGGVASLLPDDVLREALDAIR